MPENEPSIGKRLTSYRLALWYSSKAKHFRREGNELFRGFRYPECISAFGTSIEFASKAICAFLGVGYRKKEHDASKSLVQLSFKYVKQRKALSRAAWISSRWVGAGQQTRLLANYGNQDADVPATEFICKKDVELIKSDAEESCDLLNEIEVKQKLGFPRKLGILNGYVDESDAAEKGCTEYTFTEFKIEDWVKKFSESSNLGKYEVEKIPISKISSEYSVIINPFGETYPEKNTKSKFVFNHLKSYVEDGGILVNVAGFPFFYAWDVTRGGKEPVVDEKILVPANIRQEDGRLYADGFSFLLRFEGSLAWRDLELITTSDTDVMSGVNQLDVFQEIVDKGIAGDIVSLGGHSKVFEFRAVLKDSTKGVTPLLRARRPDFNEIYPIAAVKRGFGYYLVGGMNTKSPSEFEKLSTTIDSFCNWLQAQP
jgi:hypothetical protein